MLLIIDIRRDDTSLGQFTLGKSMVNFNIYSTTQVNKGGIRVDAKEGIRLPLDVLYCFDLKQGDVDLFRGFTVPILQNPL